MRITLSHTHEFSDGSSLDFEATFTVEAGHEGKPDEPPCGPYIELDMLKVGVNGMWTEPDPGAWAKWGLDRNAFLKQAFTQEEILRACAENDEFDRQRSSDPRV